MVDVPQVAQVSYMCGTLQILEETGNTAADRAESSTELKVSNRSGEGRNSEWHSPDVCSSAEVLMHSGSVKTNW